MSATPFTSGRFKYEVSGVPLSGGKLYAYKAGTLIAQDTFTGQDGLVANPNPVILDSTGSADVWLTGNYKFILQDATGVQIWSEDNYSDVIFSTAFSATSTTSIGIASGSKSFQVQSGKSFAVGQFLIAASNADATNYMLGNVTSYSGTTLVINVTNTGGSGTKTDWNISLSGKPGPQGSTGPAGPGGGDCNTSISSTVDGYAAIFDGTTGKLIKAWTSGLGSAASKDVGTGPNQLVQLDGSSKLPAVDGSALTNLPAPSISASNIISGTIATARLGSGTANNTTFLRGDQTYAVPTGSTTYQAVGTYTYIDTSGSATVNAGATIAGSFLTGALYSGTWRNMSGYTISSGVKGLLVRTA